MGVWLVEDDALVLETLTEALRDAGLFVETHTHAEAALIASATSRPDALITDINLGRGMDGVTLGRTLRARFADLPVVYISGRYGELRGLSAQERFLLKPFPASALLRALRDLRVMFARDLAV